MDERDAYKLLHAGVLAFADAEENGVRVDVEYCRAESDRITQRIREHEQQIRDSKLGRRWQQVYGESMNIYSNAQLGKMLYEQMGLEPPKRTPKGAGSTDEETLKKLGMEELDLLLRLRKLFKMRDTYLANFLREQVDGYIHPVMNLHTVRTYRSSVDSPNLQNVPMRDKEAMQTVRRAIIPRRNQRLLEVDFSGIEVNIAAAYHQDPTMLAYLRDEHADMHGDLAHQIFMLDPYDDVIREQGFKPTPALNTLRNSTKNSFTFPQFYGDYYGNSAANFCAWTGLPPQGRWRKGQGIEMPDGKALSDHMREQGIKSYNGFLDHLENIEHDFWNRRFSVYKKWRDTFYAKYQKRGWFDMLTGFRCRGLSGRNDVTNYPVQGAAFHCLLWSFIHINERLIEQDFETRLVNQVHDSMIFDVAPDELEAVAKLVRRVTEHDLRSTWPWIIVPLEIEAEITPIDHSWACKEPYELPEVV